MNYEVQIDGETIVYGPLIKRSRFSDEQWSAINHAMAKRNFSASEYEKYKKDEFVIGLMADRTDLAERYEALLELLPQSAYSKAGTHPEWVADAVEHNILIKGITQDDVKMLIEGSDDMRELIRSLEEYFHIEEEEG
ncbi:hypothetical protein [Enterococcus sp. DIV1314a]|uniref:hypothetical protein n=1 Tax=Enterococcus sp. DIV1314a TaxID=2774660 RepID=UPI003F2881E9